MHLDHGWERLYPRIARPYELLDLIREAIDFHLEGMREAGEAIPEPTAVAEYVEV